VKIIAAALVAIGALSFSTSANAPKVTLVIGDGASQF
jgi:hypothetical protein